MLSWLIFPFDGNTVGAHKSFNQVFADKLTRSWKMKGLTERSISIHAVPDWRNKFPVAVTLAWVNLNIFSWPGTSREFIIEFRLKKCSLRRCQSPEEATLNVFRYHWDCRSPRALLFSSWRAKVCVCVQVCVCVYFRCSMCLYSCVIVCMGLINSQVRGAPSACTTFDRAGAGWEGRSCHPLCETNYW